MLKDSEKKNMEGAVKDLFNEITSIKSELQRAKETKTNVNDFLDFHINDLEEQLEQKQSERKYFNKTLSEK